MPKSQHLNRDKLGELILLIAQRCAGDEAFGAVRMNKTLFYTDFLSFLHHGKSVTGGTYMRQPQGPVPKHFVPVRESLVEEGAAVVQKRSLLSGKSQHRIVALRDPDLSEFTAADMQMVESVLRALEGVKADKVSDFSHNRIWEIAQDHEEIPYETVFLSEDPPTPCDIQRGLELAKKYHWDV